MFKYESSVLFMMACYIEIFCYCESLSKDEFRFSQHETLLRELFYYLPLQILRYWEKLFESFEDLESFYDSHSIERYKEVEGDRTISPWLTPHRHVSTSLGFEPEYIQWGKCVRWTAWTQKSTVYPSTSYFGIGRCPEGDP